MSMMLTYLLTHEVSIVHKSITNDEAAEPEAATSGPA
jgi:hypothetical protein